MRGVAQIAALVIVALIASSTVAFIVATERVLSDHAKVIVELAKKRSQLKTLEAWGIAALNPETGETLIMSPGLPAGVAKAVVVYRINDNIYVKLANVTYETGQLVVEVPTLPGAEIYDVYYISDLGIIIHVRNPEVLFENITFIYKTKWRLLLLPKSIEEGSVTGKLEGIEYPWNYILVVAEAYGKRIFLFDGSGWETVKILKVKKFGGKKYLKLKYIVPGQSIVYTPDGIYFVAKLGGRRQYSIVRYDIDSGVAYEVFPNVPKPKTSDYIELLWDGESMYYVVDYYVFEVVFKPSPKLILYAVLPYHADYDTFVVIDPVNCTMYFISGSTKCLYVYDEALRVFRRLIELPTEHVAAGFAYNGTVLIADVNGVLLYLDPEDEAFYLTSDRLPARTRLMDAGNRFWVYNGTLYFVLFNNSPYAFYIEYTYLVDCER